GGRSRNGHAGARQGLRLQEGQRRHAARQSAQPSAGYEDLQPRDRRAARSSCGRCWPHDVLVLEQAQARRGAAAGHFVATGASGGFPATGCKPGGSVLMLRAASSVVCAVLLVGACSLVNQPDDLKTSPNGGSGGSSGKATAGMTSTTGATTAMGGSSN